MAMAETIEPTTYCPICRGVIRDLERVEARHVPAGVPAHLERTYGITRRYTLVECENGHRMRAAGGKGPLGWRELTGTTKEGVWS